jgi:hypothetical protein
MARNECPACGGSIMDEETLALIEHVGATISGEVMLKSEAVQKITLALLAQYDISLSNNQPIQNIKREAQPKAQPKAENTKIAPPSPMQKAEQSIIKAEDVMQEGISDIDRERIMEEAVRDKYAMVDQIQSAGHAEFGELPQVGTQESPFTEGGANPVLEQERIARLQKQQQAMTGAGAGSFRRSG